MTEENWSGAAGMAYMNSHFSMASDDTESTAAHELGHMLGAVHNFSTLTDYQDCQLYR
jgi:hypothetical protein